jgi:hypothetical protein
VSLEPADKAGIDKSEQARPARFCLVAWARRESVQKAVIPNCVCAALGILPRSSPLGQNYTAHVSPRDHFADPPKNLGVYKKNENLNSSFTEIGHFAAFSPRSSQAARYGKGSGALLSRM